MIDDNTKIENNIKLVSAGLKSKVSAIMDIFGCDEDEAMAELERISKESQISADMVDLMALSEGGKNVPKQEETVDDE